MDNNMRKGDDGDFGGSAADIHHQVTLGFVDG